MDPKHKKLLRSQRIFLAEELLVDDMMIQYLYQEEILTESHLEEIQSESSNRKKTLKLAGYSAHAGFARLPSLYSVIRERFSLDQRQITATVCWRQRVSSSSVLHRWVLRGCKLLGYRLSHIWQNKICAIFNWKKILINNINKKRVSTSKHKCHKCPHLDSVCPHKMKLNEKLKHAWKFCVRFSE